MRVRRLTSSSVALFGALLLAGLLAELALIGVAWGLAMLLRMVAPGLP